MRIGKNLRKWIAVYALLALEFGAAAGIYMLPSQTVYAEPTGGATFSMVIDEAAGEAGCVPASTFAGCISPVPRFCTVNPEIAFGLS